MSHPLTYWVPRQTEAINEFVWRYGSNLEKLSSQAKREVLALLALKLLYPGLDLTQLRDDLDLRTDEQWLFALKKIDMNEPTVIGLMQGILHLLEGDLVRNADEPGDFSSGARG